MDLRECALEEVGEMACVVCGDVFELPNAGFETLVAILLHAVVEGEGFVLQHEEDVRAVDDGSAGEVAESQHCLDGILQRHPVKRELHRWRQTCIPLVQLVVKFNYQRVQLRNRRCSG